MLGHRCCEWCLMYARHGRELCDRPKLGKRDHALCATSPTTSPITRLVETDSNQNSFRGLGSGGKGKSGKCFLQIIGKNLYIFESRAVAWNEKICWTGSSKIGGKVCSSTNCTKLIDEFESEIICLQIVLPNALINEKCTTRLRNCPSRTLSPLASHDKIE